MLKLMKYEMIHSFRTFATSFLVFILACALLPIAMHFLAGNHATEFVLGILGFIFIALTTGIMIALFLSVFMNFKHSMFDRPGYLTLTLPKSNIEILCSKLIISILWIMIGFFVLIGGFMLMLLLVYVMDGAKYNLLNLFQGLGILLDEAGRNIPSILIISLNTAVHLAFVVTSIYLALTLVHTKWVKKYKMVFAIIITFVINIALSADSFSWLMFNTIESGSYDIFNIWFYTILSGALIVLSNYVLNHHIEVE